MKSSIALVMAAGLMLTTCLLLNTAHAQQYGPPESYGQAQPYGPPQMPAYQPYPSEYGYGGGYGAGGPAYCPPRPPRLWGETEFLLAFRKSRYLPALVTTSDPGTIRDDAGVLGLTSTQLLYGDERVAGNPTAGLRAEIGVWLDCETDLGIGGSYFGLADDRASFSAASDGSPGSQILARPIYNALLDAEGSQLVAFPEIVSGRVDVTDDTHIFSADVFFRKQVGMGLFSDRVDLIGGYQYSEVNNALTIRNHLTSLDPSFLVQVGTTLDAFDSFQTFNVFHGGTMGVRYSTSFGCWSFSALGKVGLGNMRQTVVIRGRTVITVPGGPVSVSETGLLTQNSNIGTYQRDRFAVVPEGRLAVNYHFSQNLSASIGYSFMYWDRVAVAGEQVDRNVDVTQTVARPTLPPGKDGIFRETDTFVHALSLGVQLTY
jgi:hypothetical protein